MFGGYSLYLKNTQEKVPIFSCAPITKTVAEQTVGVLDGLGFDVRKEDHTEELSVKLFIDNVYTARVIEGCNSISIIVLFVAFVVSFSGSFKATLLYSLFGSLLIYSVNIARIAFLTVALHRFKELEEVLHGLVFPAIIYGLVFLLWIVWVNVFSDYKKDKNEKKV